MQVKLWRLCDPESEQPSSPELTLRPGQGRVELVHFHPTSSGLLAVSTAKSPLIWDTSRQDAPLAGTYRRPHKPHIHLLSVFSFIWIKEHTSQETSLSYILHCLLHWTFQSLSVKSPSFVVVCFFSVLTQVYIWSGGFSFLSLGTVWLTLPTFYSPVALSKCRSSRGNFLVLQSWSQSPQTGLRILSLSSGLTPLPQNTVPPAPPSSPPSHPMTAGLAATAHCCWSNFSWAAPPLHPPTHTLSLISIISHSHLSEEQLLNNRSLYLNVCLGSYFLHYYYLSSCRHYFVCTCPNKHTFISSHLSVVMMKMNSPLKLCCAHLRHHKLIHAHHFSHMS